MGDQIREFRQLAEQKHGCSLMEATNDMSLSQIRSIFNSVEQQNKGVFASVQPGHDGRPTELNIVSQGVNIMSRQYDANGQPTGSSGCFRGIKAPDSNPEGFTDKFFDDMKGLSQNPKAIDDFKAMGKFDNLARQIEAGLAHGTDTQREKMLKDFNQRLSPNFTVGQDIYRGKPGTYIIYHDGHGTHDTVGDSRHP